MDPLDEEEILAEEPATMFNPATYVLQFLAMYGWYMVFAGAAALYALHRARPAVARWRQAREDAEYHKDPDAALARLADVQRARERQQRRLQADCERALQLQRERDEKKRLEAAERLRKYGSAAGAGRRLGAADEDFLPLSGGGASTSSYRPPKRSACSGGGCGR